MELKDWANIAAIISSIGFIGAVFAVFFGWKQLKLSIQNTKQSAKNLELSAKNSKAQLWMDLRKMFDSHIEIHAKLRPDPDNPKPSPCPKCVSKKHIWPCCNSEWVKVESYMGLFEHCAGLLEEQLIDENTFRDIYRYRIVNIVNNKEVYKRKLIENRNGWLRFWDLIERFKIDVQEGQEAGMSSKT